MEESILVWNVGICGQTDITEFATVVHARGVDETFKPNPGDLAHSAYETFQICHSILTSRTACNTSWNQPGNGTCGPLGIEGAEVRIAQFDDLSRDAPCGQTGELPLGW